MGCQVQRGWHWYWSCEFLRFLCLSEVFQKPTDRRRAFRVCIAWLFDLYQTTPFLNLAKRNTYSHSWAKHDLTNPILILLTMLWRYPVLTWLCWLPLMVTHRFVDLLFFNPTHNNPCCCIIGPRTPSLSTMGIHIAVWGYNGGTIGYHRGTIHIAVCSRAPG